ncbi:cobalamin-independent methionine synthase II family protein [Klugiella xanthotipulae]|uniref:5-methyltetrahydropteroyltriglutamate--homocysteine methyltransferase n=1 Tax=Klugiella xanthotipulae TaxID=244735 RepID=A0A543HYN2_9MICO|nr:cobalamin-independent methionine synthase II family protein [Klugiella xanthotipulae]TQM63428.1 5-methyltetrahydropteroyltriglutamate--homocysteine methyltransferase [Klugiella xanthotipulae]
MLNSADNIQVTHAGSLPRTPELIAANAAKELGNVENFDALLTEAVVDLVARQKSLGVTVPGDGEYGKSMSSAVDYGAWWSYSFDRLAGLEIDESSAWVTERTLSEPGNVQLTGFGFRRDRALFPAAYSDPESGIFVGKPKLFPKVVGPLSYTGQAAIASDVRNFRKGLEASGYTEGFLTSLSPGSASRIGNDHYATQEEYIWACADALREEYLAITGAGLILQIDDPSIAENFDQIEPEPSVADYQAFTRIRVEALNYALRGIPEEQVRFHLCWGSWHGPHTTDIEMKNIVEVMLEINAGAYSFEAANVRHEHEWRVWEEVALPEGKLILPGIVSHATNVVEHPELVADRIERFARAVGRENVLASTDCGLGGRVHPDIALAKLRTLAEGAELASRRLWS